MFQKAFSTEHFRTNAFVSCFYYFLLASKDTAQKTKFPIKDFFNKCEQIRRKMRNCSHLLKKFLTKYFMFLRSEIFFLSEQINKMSFKQEDDIFRYFAKIMLGT